MKKIKVLVIDDSALVRKMLSQILNKDKDIEVVGAAADPIYAREKIKTLKPDVLTLDVEMPRMDGVTFLSNLMRLKPMPVVMVSTLTEQGADVTMNALELGAVDFITKPKLDFANQIDTYGDELIEKVKAAGSARVEALERTFSKNSSSGTGKKPERNNRTLHFKTTDTIIAIGASTGGTEAIKEVLMEMPADAPGIVIAQHIPEGFSTTFAKRMDSLSAMTVYEASDQQQVLPGHVYIAPGNRHLRIIRDGARFVCCLDDGEPVNRHKPSVDVLFNSVAENIGQNAIGAILTGMGKDGAKGLLAMRETGARTIAQDEKTSVVWGMPGSAVKLDAAQQILPLQSIAENILNISVEMAA